MTTKNTKNISQFLKDVVAYVDVWSSEKTANYSQTFIQQLEEMGAQISKKFSKQVTHVVFNNGHPATWRKAKNSNVRLVSVLWVGRCYDDRVHVDEELYPASNETNPVLKNKKHRCMQPKDSPERTPDNDRRMRKKLDMMMKDLLPKQPLVTDVSPIIIDEENGIVYSPGLKRSDYMAQRLRDMKEKRENLSPTASQMIESCSPTGLKPSLGSTPTVLKLTYDQSDDESTAAAADEPAYSPDKEEGREHNVAKPGQIQQCHKNASEKPWLADVPKRISNALKCPDFRDKEDEDVNPPKKSGTSSVRKKAVEKHKDKILSASESPCQERISDCSKNLNSKAVRSQRKSSRSSPNKTDKGKTKMESAKPVAQTKTIFFPDTVNSSRSLSLPIELAAVKMPNERLAFLQKKEQKTPKRARCSMSSLIQSFSLPGDSNSVVPNSADGDDDVFEDYFSSANNLQESKRDILPSLPIDTDIQIPFELGSVVNKRKPRRSGLETNSKRKKMDSEGGCELPSVAQQDDKETLDCPSANVTLVAKRRRQSTLPFTSTRTSNDAVKRRASTSLLSAKLMETDKPAERQTHSAVSVFSQTLESRGNACSVAAVFKEIPCEGEDKNNSLTVCLQQMGKESKVMRTLVMTSMPTEKQHIVDQVVKTLGGFSIVDQVCESTTHVVSGSHRRTLNILLGIARGCWILSFEWILWCLEQRQWIPEEPYELSDQFPAAQICRLQRHLSAGEHQQDLFQSQPTMFVSQHSQPPTQSLVELIQLCGGTVSKTVRQAGICIGKYSGRRPEGSRILSEQWVLDSITHLKQLSYDNYYLE